ncbi:MAG: hypothetical protein ABIK28_12755 [Planctomycetota bacterium]
MISKTHSRCVAFRPSTVALSALFLLGLATTFGCSSPKGHFINSQGQPLLEMDYLWEDLNEVFPGALPQRVKIVWVSGLHSSFMIDSNAIGIPSHMKSHIRRGKICRELTHLALHSLSGGDSKTPGRCFDNDIAFLEQAIAGYIDRRAADILDKELAAARVQAAGMFRNNTLSITDLRDWESFFFRGFWSDQYTQWNLDGLRILMTLGDYLERNIGLSKMVPVFESLGEGHSLDQAFSDVLKTRLDTHLKAWRDELLAAVPDAAVEPEEKNTNPEQETASSE